MYCSQCGEKREGGVCPNCGPDSSLRGKGRAIKFAVIGVVVVVAIVLGIVLLSGSPGPEQVAKNFFHSISVGDWDKFIGCFPDIWEELGEYSELAKEFMKVAFDELSAEWKEENMKVNILGSKIDGDTAVVEIETIIDGVGQKETLELVKYKGKWYIDSDSGWGP